MSNPGGNGSGGGGGQNPPPPPQVNLVDILMKAEENHQIQNQLLEALVQGLGPRGGEGGQQRRGYGAFLQIDPPIFCGAKVSLDADHWIRTMEQKFGLIVCEDHEKATFAAHQLQDAAGAWWQGYLAQHEAGHRVSWDEFKQAIRAFHILEGVMEIKAEEFRKLRQGNKSVMEYVNAFNHLAQYAPDEVSSDSMKRQHFKNDLSLRMQDKLSIVKFDSFNEMVSMAISTEHKMNELEAENRKRKVCGVCVRNFASWLVIDSSRRLPRSVGT